MSLTDIFCVTFLFLGDDLFPLLSTLSRCRCARVFSFSIVGPFYFSLLHRLRLCLLWARPTCPCYSPWRLGVGCHMHRWCSTPAYGVEIDVSRRFFFWAPPGELSGPGYEQAALQAVAFLQKMYRFVVVDYNFQGVVQYSEIARSAVSVAATAAGVLGRVARGRKELVL